MVRFLVSEVHLHDLLGVNVGGVFNVSHFKTVWVFSASKRRGNSLKRGKDLDLTAEARIRR